MKLRRSDERDFDGYYALCSDKETAYYCGFKAYESKEELQKKFPYLLKYEYYSIIEDGNFAGYIVAYNDVEEHREDVKEIGFALLPSYRGKGLMQKAIKEILKILFDRGISYVWATCYKENESSRKTIEKAGFLLQEEGYFFSSALDKTFESYEYCIENPEKRKKEVILVEYHDEMVDVEEKMEAHRKGLLHRAFSLFLFDQDKVLLQKRAAHKYHCGGLWTNACCSHPMPGEKTKEAVIRRVKEELGIKVKEVEEAGSFIYRASFENGLSEYEYDHVYVGAYKGEIPFNKEEIEEVLYVSLEELEMDLLKNPEKYTPWFLTAYRIALSYYEEYKK